MAPVRWIFTVAIILVLSAAARAESDPKKEGQQALKKKDYDRAIACFTRAIEANPRDAASYRRRGEAYLGQENVEKALADLNEAIRLDPKDSEAYLNRADAYGEWRERGKVLADLNEVIRLIPSPKSTKEYLNRAKAYNTLGDYAKALADCEEALRLDPKLLDALLGRAYQYPADLALLTHRAPTYATREALSPSPTWCYYALIASQSVLGVGVAWVGAACRAALEVRLGSPDLPPTHDPRRRSNVLAGEVKHDHRGTFRGCRLRLL